MGKKLTKKIFVEKSIAKHGNKYDYSKSVYNGLRNKILITCPEHGDFWQAASNHCYNGHGCPECGIEILRHKIRSNTSEFIEKATAVHGNLYDYGLVEYEHNKKPVKIVCATHGVFPQRPNDHLMGSICPSCAHPSKRSNTEEFIEKATAVHGDRYDYSCVSYKRAKRKIKILCKDHGEFSQTPNDHLNGQGCPRCTQSYGEETVAGILDSIGVDYAREVSFNGCAHKKKLRFDFEVKQNGSSVLVEYDGAFHYVETRFRNSKKLLKGTQNRDRIKDKFAEENGIPLIRIPYTVDDIESFLLSRLSEYIDVGG